MANEKRLIDANALLERMNVVTADDTCPLHIAAEIDQEIELAPTVDAVEVVYCKDCARCKKGYCTIRKDGWGATLRVGKHDFCSDGERRTDNA